MILSKKSFKTTLVLFICTLFCVILLIQITFTSIYVRKIITDNSEIYFKEIIAQIVTRTEAEFELCNQLASQISKNTAIIYHLGEMSTSDKSPRFSMSQITKEVINLLPKHKQFISDVYIFTPSGLTINCFYSTALEEIDPYSQLLMNQLQHNPRTNETIWDDVYFETQYLSSYTPIIHNNQLIALLRMRFDKNIFSDTFDEMQLDKSNIVLLLDEFQNIVYSNQTSLIGQNKNALSLNNYYEVSTNHSLDKQSGMHVVGFIPHNAVSSEITLLNLFLLVLYASTFSILLFLVITYLKKLSKPISNIVSGMKEVQSGNLDIRLEPTSEDEFKFISTNFNEMLNHIQALMAQIYTFQKNSALVQKEALEAKLHPHFLYNTLDSIYWMLIMQDNANEATMVIKLSNILRYSISHDEELVPLYEDIKQLENYIDLHRIRFHNQLEYSINVDDAIKDIRIPKLLLQPLVENTLKYGFKKIKKNSLIRITATAKKDFIQFIVYDNGVGIPKEKYKNILKTGLGLRITQERIQCIYGESYRLEIESSPQNGTTIIVKIGYEPIFTL